MQPELYKYLIDVAVLILMAGLGFLVWKWPQGKHRTFSQHAAAYTHTIFYYIGLFVITLPLIVTFFAVWFVPTFHTSGWLTVCIVLSAVAQCMATLVPELGGWRTVCHTMLAFLSAVLLLPVLCLILAVPTIGVVSRIVCTLSALAMLAVILAVDLKNVRHANLLLLQATYYAAFFLAIVTVTHIN